MEQVRRMWTLRVKLDSWSHQAMVDESIRQRNRDLLTDSFLKVRPARFWLYAKMIRAITTYDEASPLEEISNFSDPEDILAQGKSISSLFIATSADQH
jgi:hypothetical protein